MCACCAIVDGVQFPSDDVINAMKRLCVLYCTALYCTVLHCTVLHCTVLYRTVSCSIELKHEEDLARWRRRRMESIIN